MPIPPSALSPLALRLPRATGLRLIDALTRPDGWSGAAGRHRHRNGLRLHLSADAERGTLDLLLPAPTLRLASPSGAPPVPDALPGPYGLLGLLPLAEEDAGWPIGHLQGADLPEDGADLGRRLDAACGPLAHARLQALGRALARRHGAAGTWTNQEGGWERRETIHLARPGQVETRDLPEADHLSDLLEACGLRALRGHGLARVCRIAWDAAPQSAHDRVQAADDARILAELATLPEAPAWLRDLA